MAHYKVLVVEINEITWNLIDPLIAEGKLPNLAYLKTHGAWAAPMSVDLPPQLDPWITWTTVYTGVPQSQHNVFFLQQPPETIRAKRVWEICSDYGKSVGIYGSVCSWPPQSVNGYYVPDSFAPDVACYPSELDPIQQLNLTYTRSVRIPSEQDTLAFKARLGLKLLRLGLKPATVMRIAAQLVAERRNPAVRWKRVALQPLVNFEFFSKLYRVKQPEFATFHTNHVAHYMHTYWKAMEPQAFPQPTTDKEIRDYGGAVEHGYVTADALLGRIRAIIDDRTVLIVASSMGQKPFVSPHLRKGKATVQLRSLDKLLELIGADSSARALPVMSDQFNVYANSPDVLGHLSRSLEAAYVDLPDQKMFHVNPPVGDSFTVSLVRHDEISSSSQCNFPVQNIRSLKYHDLVYDTGMIKSGGHDPKGMLIVYGPGIAPGEHIGDCDNLDIAPTLLSLLEIPIPNAMKGRVLLQTDATAYPSGDLRHTMGA